MDKDGKKATSSGIFFLEIYLWWVALQEYLLKIVSAGSEKKNIHPFNQEI